MKDPGATTDLATLTGRGASTEGAGLLHQVSSLLHPHPQGRTKQRPMMLLQCALHRGQRVFHQITSPMHRTNSWSMFQEVDQTIRMPHPLATKVAHPTRTVGQAQPIQAIILDTRVEGLATGHRPLTKVVVLAMVAVHQTTKAKQVTTTMQPHLVTTTTQPHLVTTTTQPHLPMRGGTGRGGSTNREHC
jgi:hypothetical protein